MHCVKGNEDRQNPTSGAAARVRVKKKKKVVVKSYRNDPDKVRLDDPSFRRRYFYAVALRDLSDRFDAPKENLEKAARTQASALETAYTKGDLPLAVNRLVARQVIQDLSTPIG